MVKVAPYEPAASTTRSGGSKLAARVDGKVYGLGATTCRRYTLGATSGKRYSPSAPVVSTLGAGVSPSARKTFASAFGWPPLPPPVTSSRVTTAPATGALVLLSKTTPNGSTSKLASIWVAPQPVTDTVNWSFGLTLSRPSPRTSGERNASTVGT